MTPTVSVQPEDFDPGTETAALEATGAGAIATFCGNVRGDDGVTALELEHYPGMTEQVLASIAADTARRWDLLGLTVIHRVGKLETGTHIVFVGVASAHRRDAIDAMHSVIDRLKTDAPFWKQEYRADGNASWVEARKSDEAARDRWRSE